jgi:glycine/sarcosine N-methyltransferase
MSTFTVADDATDTNATDVKSGPGVYADADYAHQYNDDFVSRWDELIDWQKRAEGEGTFFIDLLRKAGAFKVLDVSTGSGFHAVQLRKAGFHVVACDGSPTMIKRAEVNFRRHGLNIPIRQSDWLELDSQVLGKFDAVVCLGSSLCHAFDEKVRHQVLQRFRSLLKPGGLLVIDQRNFQAIRAGNFKASGRYYYCGKTAQVSIGEVTDQVCEFVYTFSDSATFRLRVYPILPQQLSDEIEQAAFSKSRSYGDFKSIYDAMNSDFIVHTAVAL